MCSECPSFALSIVLLAGLVVALLGAAFATYLLASERTISAKLRRALEIETDSYGMLLKVRFNEGATGAPFKKLTGRFRL